MPRFRFLRDRQLYVCVTSDVDALGFGVGCGLGFAGMRVSIRRVATRSGFERLHADFERL